MQNCCVKDDSCCFEKFFEELYTLESIIKLTKESCSERELSASYYNISDKEKIVLSRERNNYINMLTIAQDKIYNLSLIGDSIEQEYSLLKQNSNYGCGHIATKSSAN